MFAERMKECFAMMMIGDGMLGVVDPKRHAALWLQGPSWWRAMIEPFANRPTLTRFVGAGMVGLGLWLASNQTPEPSPNRIEELAHS